MALVTSPGILTPPASSAAPSQHASSLPQPRRQPLRPGGPKESELIRYLDHGINNVQKRVDNRTTNRKLKPVPGEENGYGAYSDVAADLDALVDVVWVSGSPNLQIPYLLNIAVLAAEFLPMFPASCRSAHATFHVLAKLDDAFASLLTGHDAATGESLSGFETGRHVSTTDQVRLKGIVDRTRLAVARAIKDAADDESDGGEPMTTDAEGETRQQQGTVKFEGFDDDEEDEDEDEERLQERSIASVYEKTIGELGHVLGGPPIGIITDDWHLKSTGPQRCGESVVESEGEMDF
ncbi:hypothetical protein BDU57DRAFT_540098 [Ampelomyces quisqualis]|uniref:Uncharacterized protein n=1 Tax=Ampelomyces quisqualis TaxID=50730 RepID=A0A6A5QJ78_AMPQU|nr:hypothetical protein BDU57DRAFT_540098 [Ampelomyces quisqualis]